ncbi:MAG TPA: lipopolysaccharide kinase InaA family protein, partial [Actinomycetota bacterium]|nr:lipopolysaccharide kinase InaA family protein [Actinomycetota bacterium]
PGRSLEDAGAEDVGDATLAAAWREVATLHRAGMAHGDLGRHGGVVDEDGRPWLVDFDHASAVAPERLRQADLVELLGSLAACVGPDRAVAGAVKAFGREPLAAALAATTPRALTQTTREELDDNPDLWDQLARRVAAPAPEPAADGDAAVRRRSSDPSR